MVKNEEIVKLVAVGDVIPRDNAVFDPTRSILKGSDITFGQLEGVLSRRGTQRLFERPPFLNRQPEGAPPKEMPWKYELSIMEMTPETARAHSIEPNAMLEMLSNAGFNVMSFASNHTYARGEEGIIDTIKALKSKNIACIGAGKNIDEATKPEIFEKKGNKIGFLAYCSVVPPGAWATAHKAGLAPLRVSTSYEQIDWQPGSPPLTHSKCHQDDLAGMIDDIKKLRKQVDVLIVSMHWGVHMVPGLIAEYQIEAGHAAIDAGADLILGHHAHILKAVEVYKGKAIFYSLCNFSMKHRFKVKAHKASGLYWTTHFGPMEVDIERPYYNYPPDSQKTIIVDCDIANKKLQRVSYLPCWINAQSAPETISRSDPRSEEHLRYMQWCCGSQGFDTHFSQEEDKVIVVT